MAEYAFYEEQRVKKDDQDSVMRLRKALADALESMEDGDMQLAERVIRRGLDETAETLEAGGAGRRGCDGDRGRQEGF